MSPLHLGGFLERPFQRAKGSHLVAGWLVTFAFKGW